MENLTELRFILNDSDGMRMRIFDEILANIAEKVDELNDQLRNDFRVNGMIPIDTGTVDEMKQNWYHLQRC